MTKKFKDIYRIPSARLKGKIYSYPGRYFITICTANRECLFGEISGSKMRLNQAGKIVKQEFEKSFKMRKELVLDKYVIMPDHIHAIVVIKHIYKGKNIGINDSKGNIIDSHGNVVDPCESIILG